MVCFLFQERKSFSLIYVVLFMHLGSTHAVFLQFCVALACAALGSRSGCCGEGSLSQVKAVPADTLDHHIRNSPPSNFLLKTQLFLSALLQLNTVLRVAQNSFNTQKKDNKLTLRY